ncbi:MAG: Crp/Fnr family transcriptional regulator [Tissierellia bacterium]|nr:Crp/Fnr family transcriptional regulator [Tissierellia bacterium]
MKKYINILKNTPFFHGKTEEEIEELLQGYAFSIEHYKKNQLIFLMGEPANDILLIVKGCLLAKRYLATGKTLTISHKSQGEMYGESALSLRQKKWSCSILAAEPSVVLRINILNYLRLLEKDKTLLLNYISVLSDKILDLEFKSELLSYRGIQEKVAYYLLYVTPKEGSKVITLPFTYTQWAQYLSVSRPTLARNLTEMEQKNLLRRKGRKITILNREALELLLEG